MSTPQLIEAVHELEALGVIVQREGDESLAEAIDELGLADPE
jgi:hypothetical protein